ncbi:phosphoribosylaminoimidazole-succinocarboxamide synthase [Coccidioides immitis H538.4]|uniref:Phosphoribosylaminoimidazole-succinocarboxamide synthase n=1 Tax=Coccidioides immitis H538.4 TaxID=396776 RepID=A0A0J8RH13_COCIT|nr:phosphoribosylaminoimidazole-succinocarboxamide synthase [Coccidioides immitis H538.4]
MTRQSNAEPFMASNLGEIFPLVAQGKVREIYKIDEETLLFVASDRISAYDVILDNGVPNKGVILTLISAYWFKFLKAALPTLQTHFIGLDLPHGIPTELRPKYQDRSMVVRKIKVFPIESIVRGYISGSAWKEYKESGTVNGISMPTGLVECGRLPTALWTPSTKADQGDHDINIHPRDGAVPFEALPHPILTVNSWETYWPEICRPNPERLRHSLQRGICPCLFPRHYHR